MMTLQCRPEGPGKAGVSRYWGHWYILAESEEEGKKTEIPVLTARNRIPGSSWSQEEAPLEVKVLAEVHRWSVQWGTSWRQWLEVSSPGTWVLPLRDQTS